ncbi:ABC transporter ATP-binding protein [Oenococcus sicerae]|uniref:ABC transporter ATP-binding protein n=1 Tax=Oenococcus sicerae TaxID=2203724 RepID=A0ABX5QKS6_9LACO|nr:ABC transporter transmembrane domain-containing protein [Oenococcus sicerae]QAS69403.1 ABC transporter ATP-binding protein [Oenococcus sicerae]
MTKSNLNLKWLVKNVPWWVTALTVLLAIGGAFEGVINGYAFGQITAIATHGISNIWTFLLRFVALYFLTYTSLYFFSRISNRALMYANIALKNTMAENAFRVSYQDNDSSKVLNQITADARQIQDRYFLNLPMVLQTFFTGLVSTVFVLRVNLVLGLISILFAAISILPSMIAGGVLDQASNNWSNRNKTYIGRLKELLSGVAIIKNYQAQVPMLQGLKRISSVRKKAIAF